ncbi:MAG: hypothetical protein ACI4O7_07820 [Aristaeellaceae bacterium]
MQAIWIAAALAMAVGLWLMLREKRERTRQKRMIGYLRQSDLYAHLYPLILQLEQMHVESVAIRREELRVRTYKPAGKVYRFTFEKHGFDPVEDDRLFALAQAVGVDAPKLRDRRRYEFIVHEDERDHGGKAAWYEYMILTEYKDDMSRADYLNRR